MTSKATSAQSLNVLVVDDDEGVRGLLAEIVGGEGHQVLPVPSAEAALELLPSWTFHVAILDQRLPGMDGLVLGGFLRRNNPDLAIALMTGDDEPKLERRARDLGISFIRKPFHVGDILGVIESYVQDAGERHRKRVEGEDADFAPPIGRFVRELTERFGMPNVPQRTRDRLIETTRRALHDLRSVGRYTEHDRVVALSGLITAAVLNVPLPRTQNGKTLFEEYDELMRMHGRRTEFGA
ncbi:MAG: response regulator [Deltaproteobacteria bacterium]|nr:response regulator [Deltaproteobacteria bacterium]